MDLCTFDYDLCFLIVKGPVVFMEVPKTDGGISCDQGKDNITSATINDVKN